MQFLFGTKGCFGERKVEEPVDKTKKVFNLFRRGPDGVKVARGEIYATIFSISF